MPSQPIKRTGALFRMREGSTYFVDEVVTTVLIHVLWVILSKQRMSCGNRLFDSWMSSGFDWIWCDRDLPSIQSRTSSIIFVKWCLTSGPAQVRSLGRQSSPGPSQLGVLSSIDWEFLDGLFDGFSCGVGPPPSVGQYVSPLRIIFIGLLSIFSASRLSVGASEVHLATPSRFGSF